MALLAHQTSKSAPRFEGAESYRCPQSLAKHLGQVLLGPAGHAPDVLKRIFTLKEGTVRSFSVFFVFTRDIQIAFIETKNVNVLRIFVAASFRFIS